MSKASGLTRWQPSWTSTTTSPSGRATTALLIHRHLKDKTYDGTVRVSVGAFTTKADLDALVDALRGLDRAKLKGIAPDILRGNC